MKKLLLVTLLLSMNCMADYRELEVAEFGNARHAIKDYLLKNARKYDCGLTETNEFSHYLNNTEMGLVDEDSNQPLYKFLSKNRNHAVIVTTSSDFKAVTQIEYYVYNDTEVNVGDLLHPEFVKAKQTIDSHICKRQQAK